VVWDALSYGGSPSIKQPNFYLTLNPSAETIRQTVQELLQWAYSGQQGNFPVSEFVLHIKTKKPLSMGHPEFSRTRSNGLCGFLMWYKLTTRKDYNLCDIDPDLNEAASRENFINFIQLLARRTNNPSIIAKTQLVSDWVRTGHDRYLSETSGAWLDITDFAHVGVTPPITILRQVAAPAQVTSQTKLQQWAQVVTSSLVPHPSPTMTEGHHVSTAKRYRRYFRRQTLEPILINTSSFFQRLSFQLHQGAYKTNSPRPKKIYVHNYAAA
jgi:hypothetical protein